MKRIIAVAAALTLLAFGAIAYAQWEGGPGYGPGYGYGMGPGGCWGDDGRPSKADIEKRDAFFKETYELRKKLHEKMFDLREAYRTDDEKKIEAIEKEIEKLQEEIAKVAEKLGITQGKGQYGRRGGYGRHMSPGYGPMGPGMMGPGYGPYGPGY